jgi:agmatine deiminase
MATSTVEPGLRMPAEWEPHEATWIAWPHRRADWPGKFAAIGWVYCEIVRLLHTHERVQILVNDLSAERRARRALGRAGVDVERIRFFHFATDRVWTRDYGPQYVRRRDGGLGVVNWQFNGWAKYPEWQADDAVARQVAATLGLPVWEPRVNGRRIVLEGGAIDVNGVGLMLTTEECLASSVQERNPGLGREELEGAFAEYLGIRNVLWLGCGIAGDDTHGHVDDLARFVGRRTVVLATEDNPADDNYRPLQENRERLQGTTDLEGRHLEVVPLPMPAPVFFEGQRLPASYANFYIANEIVLVPTFNDPNDREALGILSEVFPDRTVVGIHSVDLVWGLGTIHCLTQQQPEQDSASLTK